MKKNLSAGDVVEARCTRCRTVTNHTIVAMVEDKVARVQCNTCNGVHNYYSPAEKRPTRIASQKDAGAPKRPRAGRQSAAQAEWEELSRSADLSAALRYEMGRGYRVNDLVQHPVFGLGVVKTTTKPNKMEVLFEGGVKLLRCTL
jgi:hypothetical protein